MVIQKMMHPLIGYLLFMVGMVLASMLHPAYGILTILGGILIGISNFSKLGGPHVKKLYDGSFLFLFAIMTIGYLIAIKFIL